MPNDQADRFLRTMAKHAPDWSGLEVRAVGVRGKAGEWHLRALRATLHPEPPAHPTHGPTSDSVWTGTEWLPLTDVPRLLSEIESGAVCVAGKNLLLRTESNSRISLSYHYSAHDSRYRHSPEAATSAHVLGSSGSHQFDVDHERMEILEMGLAHMDPPWEGYDDLIRNFLGQEVQGRTDRTQLSLAILEHRGDETIRRTKTHLSAIPGSAWTFKHTLSHDAVRVVVIASYREVRAGYWTKTINPRGQGSAFNRAVDFALDGKSVLDDGLLNPDVRGRKLEPWLTLLFAKMGYCTAPLGALAGDMPDLLAAADDLPLLVVECTEDSPDVNDKLGKLSMRAKKVAAAAGTETLPVLVTRLEASKVPESHRRKAADERIALVAQEQLVDFAEGSRDPPHAHAFLLSCIPARPNNSGVRNGITRFI